MRLSIAIALSACVAVAAEVKYEPAWESLDKRPTPQWFTEARFGIFIHWGVYSVPAWAPRGRYAEWYWHAMQNKKGPTWRHHVQTYGADFTYQQFAPMFKAERYDPEAWAELFKKAGARYVVLTSKHHDGFCLWPSAQAKGWNAGEVGPRRDLIAPLAEACRKRKIRFGLYYSFYEWFSPLYRKDTKRYVEEHMIPQFKDIVTRYKPDIVWPDGEWERPPEVWRSTELLAWLFNESPCRDYVAVNDRWGRGCRGRHGGYYTSEYGGHGGKTGPAHPWEECQGIGRSFGYNRNEGPQDYKTAAQCIRLLVDCAARGGNLLLDIGPAADGTIPQIMQDRLLAIGRWLAVNGESIYATSAGPIPKLPWGRTTASPGKVYLHVFEWPKNGELAVPGLRAQAKCAYRLADPDKLWLMVGQNEDGDLTISVPRKAPDPTDSVIVLELEGAPRVAIGKPTAQRPDGSVPLHAANAVVHGSTARYESGGGKDNIGFWNNPSDWVSWKFSLEKPGTFEVAITFACATGSGGSTYRLTVAGQSLEGKVRETGGWTNFVTEKLGTVKLDKPGDYTLAVRPIEKSGRAVMNLRSVLLTPVKR